MKKIIATFLVSASLLAGCVSSNPQGNTNSIKPETALVTALIISETKASDRAKIAQEVYNAADVAEKLINKGATLADVKKYALDAIGTGSDAEQKRAILSAVLDYVDAKYNVTVGLTDVQKKEIVQSAIDGVKSAVSPYLAK